MKLLFMTNVPSPYRVDFFNELGKKCELVVTFEKRNSDERGHAWDGYKFINFKGIFLKGKSINTDTAICPEIIKYVGDRSFDHIICADFLSPTGMIAIEYMRFHQIQYWLESDGGFAKDGRGIKEKIKKHFISGAKGYFSTAEEHDKYYLTYGAPKNKIFRYPFTSLKYEDLMPILPSADEKAKLKSLLGMKEKYCIISVGRFSYLKGRGKGFDLLLKIAEELDNSVGVYIIGDEPTEEFKQQKDRKGSKLKNLHFIDFKKKKELFAYYRAADIFVLLTKGEAWGLVINEAMANGLPIITTTRCIAGMELVKEGINGYLVSTGDFRTALEKINKILRSEDLRKSMAQKSIQLISAYTIEKMAEKHLEIIAGGGYIKWIKAFLRDKLDINEKHIVLAVGQFIPRKGFDVLIKAMKHMDKDIGVYIVGGEATTEYLDLKRKMSLENLHFCGYKSRGELKEWYLAADIFVHPTREDIWGLVINEAMASGLPVVTTNRCIAGLELIKHESVGTVVQVNDERNLADSIQKVITQTSEKTPKECMKLMKNYTIHDMSLRHMDILLENNF